MQFIALIREEIAFQFIQMKLAQTICPNRQKKKKKQTNSTPQKSQNSLVNTDSKFLKNILAKQIQQEFKRMIIS